MKKKKVILLAVVLVILISTTYIFSLGSGANYYHDRNLKIFPLSQMETELEEMRKEIKVPAISAVLAVGDSIIWSKATGWADKENEIAVTEKSIFHLASLTKPFATVVLLQLVQEGKLDLNEPVAEHGVEIESEGTVKVWHLLSHTSSGVPGSTFKYDGNAFGQLEKIIESVTGRTFAEELYERIIHPLQLRNTMPNPLDESSFIKGGGDEEVIKEFFVTEYARAWGRKLWPSGLIGPLKPINPPTYFGTAAGLVSTANDVAKFSIAIDQGSLLNDSISSLSMTHVKSNSGENFPFGLGWFIENYNNKKILWQYGHWFGSSSLIIKVPEDKVTFVILANSDGLSRMTRIGDKATVMASPVAPIVMDLLTQKDKFFSDEN